MQVEGLYFLKTKRKVHIKVGAVEGGIHQGARCTSSDAKRLNKVSKSVLSQSQILQFFLFKDTGITNMHDGICSLTLTHQNWKLRPNNMKEEEC